MNSYLPPSSNRFVFEPSYEKTGKRPSGQSRHRRHIPQKVANPHYIVVQRMTQSQG
jgi:hypothetical protein